MDGWMDGSNNKKTQSASDMHLDLATRAKNKTQPHLPHAYTLLRIHCLLLCTKERVLVPISVYLGGEGAVAGDEGGVAAVAATPDSAAVMPCCSCGVSELNTVPMASENWPAKPRRQVAMCPFTSADTCDVGSSAAAKAFVI